MRLVWLLVLVQGWLLVPLTWTVEIPATDPVHAPAEAFLMATLPIAEGEIQIRREVHLPQKTSFDWTLFAGRGALVVWLAGALVLVVPAVWSYARLARQLAGATQPPAEWQQQWYEARRRSKLRGQSEFRVSEHLGPLVCFVPFVFLVVVPRVLWSQLSLRDRRAILDHEIAHLKRGDLWKNLAVRLLALPQWFNPLAWLAVRRFEEAGEWACDELVARRGECEPASYAGTLLRVAGFATETPVGGVAATGGELTRRVRRLLTLPDKEVGTMRNWIALLLLLAVVVWQNVRIESVEAGQPATASSAAEPVAKMRGEPKFDEKLKKWNFDEPYVIEPPDIIVIRDCKMKADPTYKVQPFDGLLVRSSASGIADAYFVDPDGKIDLGPKFGSKCHVAGITMAEAKRKIRKQIQASAPGSHVHVSLTVMSGVQQVIGEHLVGPDGKIKLGAFGTVYITGLTTDKAAAAIVKKVNEDQSIQCTAAEVDVMAYNSKRCYVIIKRGAVGDNVVSIPVTGNETVLDVIAKVGPEPSFSTAKIWVGRPAPNGVGNEIKLPVKYDEITRQGKTETNHRLLPGDRLFIEPLRVRNVDLHLAPQAPPAPEVAPAGAYQAVGKTAEKNSKKARLKMQCVVDLKGNMREIAGLEDGSVAWGDTPLVLSLLRVMEKNELVQVTGSKTLTPEFNMAAEVQFGAKGSSEKSAGPVAVVEKPLGRALDEYLHECKFKSFGATVFSRLQGYQVYFETILSLEGNDGQKVEQHFACALKPNQSCICRMPLGRGEAKDSNLYVVISRLEEE